MDSLTELYCLIGDSCRIFEPVWERRLLTVGAKAAVVQRIESCGVDDLGHPVLSAALPPVQELLP
jgi:hypothetical protein